MKDNNIIKDESLKVKMEIDAIKLENKVLKEEVQNSIEHSALIK